MSTNTVTRSSKSDEAYQQLVHMIHEGQIGVGEPLTEAKAVRLTGLNRGPVRESILRLEAEGFLKQRGNRRSRVVGVLEDENRDEVLFRYEVREQIESGAARAAAKNMTGWQVDRLCELAVEFDKYFTVDYDERRHLPIPEYHEYLMANCGNPLLYQIWQSYQLAPLRPRSQRTSKLIQAQVPEAVRSELPTWVDVAEAIAQHDQDLAEQRVKQRIRATVEAIRRLSWEELSNKNTVADDVREQRA